MSLRFALAHFPERKTQFQTATASRSNGCTAQAWDYLDRLDFPVSFAAPADLRMMNLCSFDYVQVRLGLGRGHNAHTRPTRR